MALFSDIAKNSFLLSDETAMDKMTQNEEIINYLKPIGLFKTSDIAAWFRTDLKDSTINWRVYELVKNDVITRISKCVFKIGVKCS